MLKKILVLLLVFATLLPTLFAESDALEAARGRPEAPAFVDNQVLVNFQPGVTTADIATFYAKHDLVELQRLGAAPGRVSRLRLAQIKPGKMTDPDGFLRTLGLDSRVEYAGLNYILSIGQVPNDPKYNQLWGMDKIGAPQAWDITTGSANVIVGVIDTGVNYSHPDLVDNIWTNLVEFNGTAGVDDDGNGYIDDIHGWNAYSNHGDPMDDHFHGSHVAGTIGAKGNNNKGVVGVNWEVKIAACKFLSSTGTGSTAGAIACFDYFNQLRADGHNVLLTNNSWGGGGFSKPLETAMAGDVGNPILHAAAAGNSNNNNDASPHYPSSYDLNNIIAVAATDSNDNSASFSSYGLTSVDMSAPGVSILSTVLGTGYGTYNGTSMATPHVAGGAALIWSQYPNLSAEVVKDLLMFGVDPLSGAKATVSGGRLNVNKAINAMEDDPIPPAWVTNLTVSGAGISSLTMTWTATADDGSDPASGAASSYDARYSTSPITAGSWASATQATGEPSPQSPGSLETFILTGLLPSATYYVTVKAMDNVGNISPMPDDVSGSTDPAPNKLQDNMEGEPDNWVGTGLWNLAKRKSSSPTHAWYYGQTASGTYDTGAANSGTLTSTPVDLTNPTDATLSFSYWRQVEYYASFAYDQTYVEVSYDGGPWTRV